jgi:methylenetetrahydrofolate dehydrogenase (NADP+)/methenyltetrahydrofolate cyclohydrolase
LLEGRPVADEIWPVVEANVVALRDYGVSPRLVVVDAAGDPAAASYLRQITRTFERRSLSASVVTPETADEPGIIAVLDRQAADPSVTGILLTLPLPDGVDLDAVVEHLPVSKDVEGIHPANAGRLAQGRPHVIPSTPLAGLEILSHAGVSLEGQVAVVVGRSPIVGRPMAHLLIRENATVVTCHTRTVDLSSWTQRADILLLAAGRAGLVTGSMVRPGATVIDFGTNVVGDKLVGDAHFESVSAVAGAITPVPGGVGQVTTAVLARNLVWLATYALR